MWVYNTGIFLIMTSSSEGIQNVGIIITLYTYQEVFLKNKTNTPTKSPGDSQGKS